MAIRRNVGFDVFNVRLLIGLDKLLRAKRRYQGDLSASINDALLAVNLNTVKLVALQGKKKQTARETQVQAGYTTKVLFISTEDPNLNIGRILVRMSRGGQAVPLGTIPESYEEAMKTLPEARRHADDLLVYDNTPNGKGHRLVARFIAGELVRTNG